MRILMITDFYWPYIGGVEQHVRRLSHALLKRGHSVSVVTLKYSNLADFEVDGGVRVYRVSSPLQQTAWLFADPERPWSPPFPDPQVTNLLRQIIRQERPEIVHGHDWLARSFLPLKTWSGAKFVMSLHYYTLSCAKKSLVFEGNPCNGPGVIKCLTCSAKHYGAMKGVPVTLSNWLMSKVEKSAVDVFLPVSQATADGNGLTAKDHYHTIPNFMPEDNGAGENIDFYIDQLPKEEFLLFVGDLRRDKGIEVLLSAYAGIQNGPPLVLIGKVWAESPQEFPPNVILFKKWPNEAVLAAWSRSMMGILPSLWPEPFGIVVIEAMSSGRPVIATRMGGIPEIIKDGESGLLVPPGDVSALRHAIERLLSDPVLRKKLGSAAQKQSTAYQASVVVPRIEHIYKELLPKQTEIHEPTPSSEHYYRQL